MKPVHNTASGMTSKVRIIARGILAAVICFSCVKEITEPGTIPGGADKEIQFNIRLPYPPEPPRSRAITALEENHISSLYVLSFRVNNDAEKFDYLSEAKPHKDNVDGSAYQNFSAVLKARTDPQRLVLLANVSDRLLDQLRQGNWQGMDKDQMLSQLEETIDRTDNKWNASDVSDYRALPMWGESAQVTIDANTTSLGSTVRMLRMVARVDVQIDENEPGLTDKFRLGSVRVYNTNIAGCLVPATGTYYVDPGMFEIFAPTIPASVADYSERHLGPLIYDDFSPPGVPDIAMRNAIYLFETELTDSPQEATCLVIGGYYDGDAEESFYRVDFLDEYKVNPLHILRNHKYTVNIVDVKQHGYKNPDDAFNSRGDGIDINILHWSETDMDEIIFDGQYYYSVSPRQVVHGGKASTGNVIKVKTDFPQWSYELSDLSDPGDPLANPSNVSWLTVTSHAAGSMYPSDGNPENIVYDIGKNGTSVRTAYIHVTAGRVTMTVRVEQDSWNIERFIIDPSGDIPSAGQTRTVKAEGAFTSVKVRARDITDNTVYSEDEIVSGVNNNSTTLTVPQFVSLINKIEVRGIVFEYQDPVTGVWEQIRTDYQRTIYFFITSNYNPGDVMPSVGHIYYARVEGEFPDIYLRSASNNIQLRGGTSIPGGNATSMAPAWATIDVPTNGTGQDRDVDLQFSVNGVDWVTISGGLQPGEHYVLQHSGRIVSKEPLETTEFWAQAMGIEHKFNFLPPFYQSYTGGTNQNSDYTVTTETGCGGYHENPSGYDKGLWRLPDELELIEIMDNSDAIGNFPLQRRYWSSYESNTGTALTLAIPKPIPFSDPRQMEKNIYQNYIRCVMRPE